ARPREPPRHLDELPEVDALEILHHEIRDRLLPEVEDLYDVVVADPNGGPRFSQESFPLALVLRQVPAQHLHGDARVQLQVAPLVHRPHATFAQQANELEAPFEGLADQILRARPLRHGPAQSNSRNRPAGTPAPPRDTEAISCEVCAP